jgi:WhiB family transcriptional regulator, redox-sensing transcriptional regulator
LKEIARKYQKLQFAIKKVGRVPCEEVPYVFFPEDAFVRSNERQQMESLAVKLCKMCPVQKLCLDYALAADEGYGVWGGTTAEERR